MPVSLRLRDPRGIAFFLAFIFDVSLMRKRGFLILSRTKTKRYVPYVHFGAFLGVLIMQIILIILTVYSVNADAQLLIIGTVLIFEVALDEYAKRKQKIGSPSLGIIPVTFTYNP